MWNNTNIIKLWKRNIDYFDKWNNIQILYFKNFIFLSLLLDWYYNFYVKLKIDHFILIKTSFKSEFYESNWYENRYPIYLQAQFHGKQTPNI